MKLKKPTILFTTLWLVLLLAFTSTSFAQTIHVPSDYGTIQLAIDAASNGDIIEVAAGTYSESPNISKELTLQSVSGATTAPTTIITGSITIAANNVTVDGFTINNPAGNYGIYANDQSGITIKNNIISDIGPLDHISSSSNFGIGIICSSANISSITIKDNTISQVAGGNYTGAVGIAIGWTDGTNTVDGLIVKNNNISDVKSFVGTWSGTNVWPTTRGAYGILINHSPVNSPSILNNTISNLDGLFSHGIGLEGNTPNALVQGNVIHDLVDHKTPTDAAAIMVEDNPSANTVTINLNSFYNSLLGVRNATALAVTAEYNWWGDTDPSNNIYNSAGGSIDYTPWLSTGTDIEPGTEGFQGDFSGDPDAIVNIIGSIPSGGTLYVAPGTYNAFNVTGPITLIGNGAVVHHGSPAITVASTNVTITGFTFNYDAADYAIDVQAGAYDVTITDCDFQNTNGGVGHVGNGVINRGTGTVDARNNFWNSVTGPTSSLNPSGAGNLATNASTGTLLISPWWQEIGHSNLKYIPTLTAPINGLTGVAIQPTFKWVATTANYTLKVSKNSDMSSPVVTKTGINTNTYTLTETEKLDANTTYYWQVTDANSNKSAIWQFTTNAITITPAFPVSGTVYTTSTMFTWSISQSVGNMHFNVQVLAQTTTPVVADWGSPTFAGTTTSLFYTFTLTQGTQYYWRIVLFNNSNEVMGYSSVKTFTTSGGASVTVTTSYPTGGATVYTNPPTLYWYVNQYAPGITYVVRYSLANTTNSNGALSSLPDSLAATSNLYKAFSSALSSGTTYWWQVSARYGGSVGAWTTPTSFVTNSSGTLITPTPSYPTGGVTVYTIAPTLYWYLNGNSTSLTYNIQTKKDAGSWITAASNVSTFYYALSGLTPGSTYQWKVQSDNNGSTSGGESAWSTPETFIVSGGVTSSSTVATWPVSNPTMYTQKPTLSWYLDGSSLGVTGYKVKYSTSSETWSSFPGGSPSATKGEVTLSGVSTTYWTSTVNLTYGQNYFWAVASWDGTTAGTYSTGSFTIAGGASAGSVVLSNPIGGVTVNTKSPTLYWYFTGSTLGITGYQVAYSDNGGLTSWNYVTTTSTFKALSGLTAGATYTWKVSPSWDGGSTYPSYSSTTTFVVDPSATTIVPIVGGPNNVTINTSAAEVSWVIPTAPQGKLTYELVFADNAEMNNAQTITTTDVYSEVSSLQANKNYYWKVRSVSDNGAYSSYSNIGTFKTDDQITAVGGDKEITPTEYKLSQNYPNPFNPSTIIEYSLPEASYVSMKIYNVLGREVRTLVNGSQNAGNYQTQWNGLDNAGNKVATGMYIYRITAGNYVATKKMLLLK